MKTKTLSTIIIIAAFTTACKKAQEMSYSLAPEAIQITAKMEQEEGTKTVLSNLEGNHYHPLWEVGDSLAVFFDNVNVAKPFFLINGDGETNALFEGPSDVYDKGKIVALYPYSPSAKVEGNQLLFSLPSIQSYRSSSFSANGYPMVAVSESHELNFKNLCSIVKLSLKGTGFVSKIKLQSEGVFLSGPASVNLSFAEVPVLTMLAGGKQEVTLDCMGVPLDKDEAQDFFIVLPAQEYPNLSIIVESFTESITKTVNKQVVLNRSRLRSVTPFIVEFSEIDLDNLPNNQVWYKTKSGNAISFEGLEEKPFDANIVSNKYVGEYGVLLLDAPLKKINDYAFRSSSSDIVELHLPDCVEGIGFAALPALSTFRVPGELSSLGLWNLNNMDSVYGPLVADDNRSVVRDGKLIGVADKGLDEYVTPNGIHTIGYGSLWGKQYKKCILSEGIRIIEIDALSYSSFDAIYLPESLSVINVQADLSGIKGYYGSLDWTSPDHKCLLNRRGTYGPDLISIIKDESLEEYQLPEGIGNIRTTFIGWKNLKKLGIPESVAAKTHLGELFSDCPNFKGFFGPNISDDGLCIMSHGRLIYCHDKGLKSYVVPSGVTIISEGNFNTIEDLVVSEGVRIVGNYCFEFCRSLRSLTLPKTIIEIGNCTFENCFEIESVYLPVRIPPSVGMTPSSRGALPKLKVYVPEESYDDYLDAPGWNAGWKPYLVPYHFEDIDVEPPYESSDYSQDGKVIVLQETTLGRGIDLVLMGDAYSDRQLESGEYLSTMESAMEAFFEQEPYHSYRHLFNVYVVNAVSSSEDFSRGETAFDAEVLSDQSARCDIGKAYEYISKAIPEDRLNETTAILVVNTPYGHFGGACSMSVMEGATQTDYGSGIGVAVISSTNLKSLVWHEAGGHGFAKLADEYTNRADSDEPYPSGILEGSHRMGWYMNIDTEPNADRVIWSHFLKDSRYDKEHLGIFEGAAAYYRYGVFRPSLISIMVDNLVGYNAPSREAIYYRIHKLAYGDEWEYDYEEFVKWDQGAKNIRPTSVQSVSSGKKNYEVRDPLPVTHFDPDEWTVTVMK